MESTHHPNRSCKRNASLSFDNLSLFEDVETSISLFPNLYEETSNNSKRTKRASSLGESSEASSATISDIPRTNSLNSVLSLNFRDHIKTYTQRYLASSEVLDDTKEISPENFEDDCSYNRNNGNNISDGTNLVNLLISCAEAVACRDKSQATTLLSELRSHALVFGSSFQRVASCFVHGLADRLAMFQPLGPASYASYNYDMSYHFSDLVASEDKEEALKLVYEVCPYIRFGHFVANTLISEALEGENPASIHVVDLGMSLALPHGYQWLSLIQTMVDRPGPLPRLRITAVGLCVDKFLAIGQELEAYALGFGIDFEFSIVQASLENLKPDVIKVVSGEFLVVNSILQLHCVVKESRGALNSFLQVIRELKPKLFVLIEQDSSHNGPFFLGRFMEALHYYSAVFDSLDAALPKYDTKRAKIEQFYFAEEIKNIVSCEGPVRVERHERIDQWRRRMSRAGFQPVPLKMLDKVKKWLSYDNCEGYTVVEDKGCLALGWKNKAIISASCWKC